MADQADIAVIISTHNYGHYLKDCLASVFAQSLKARDVVVIDDASDDDTPNVVRQFDRVRYFQVAFRNGNRARNFGFEKTTCEQVVFFDADNVMLPQFLARLHAALNKDQQAAFAYCDRINFGEGDIAWYPLPMGLWQAGVFDVTRLKAQNYIDLAALIRRAWFPGFDEQLRRYQDWDLWLNIALHHRGIGHYVPEALFHYRVHGENISRREGRDRAMWYIRRKYRLGWGKVPLLRHSYKLYWLAVWVKRKVLKMT